MTASAEGRQANIDVMNRYCHALDTRDWDLLRSLFTEDMSFAGRLCVRGAPEPDAVSQEGREAFISMLIYIWEGLEGTQHMVSNHMVDLAPDGQSAKVSCYIRAYHGGSGARAHMFEESLGRFDVQTVLEGEDWKIRRLEESMFVILGSMEVLAGPAPTA